MSFLSLPFMQTAFVACLLMGNALAILGLFVLMRRMSFSGLSVSQMAALGAVCAVVLGHSYFFIATLGVVWLGFFLLIQMGKKRSLPAEAGVACLYILGASVSVLILSKAPHGEATTLSIFFGNILVLGAEEIWEAVVIFLLTGLGIGVWFHRWIWISFDSQSARVAGLRTSLWDFFFYGLFGTAMTVGIHIFGVLLAFTYLILPTTLGLLLVRRLKLLIWILPLLTTGLTFLGFSLSFQGDWPTGPFIAALFGTAVLAAVGLGAKSGSR